MKKTGELAEAIAFFQDGKLCKGMLYPEFEAILDGVVNLHELAGKRVETIFVVISARLHPVAAVFFYVDFDDDGSISTSWNLPLRQLIDGAEACGPDLGSGSLGVVCRGHSSHLVSEAQLWDPFNQPVNVFELLRCWLAGNLLGLVFTENHSDFNGPNSQNEEGLFSPASWLKRLRQAAESEGSETLRTQVLQLQQQLAEVQKENEGLQRQLREQSKAFRSELEEAAEQLQGWAQRHQTELAQLKRLHEETLERRISTVMDSLQKELLLKEELLSEQERVIQALQPELAQSVMEHLAAQGMTFVAYHPGAGKFPVAVADIPAYRQDFRPFAAAQCGLSEEVYSQWLEHYLNPVCQARMHNGQPCNLPVNRVVQPQHFTPGMSNACARHKGYTTDEPPPKKA